MFEKRSSINMVYVREEIAHDGWVGDATEAI